MKGSMPINDQATRDREFGKVMWATWLALTIEFLLITLWTCGVIHPETTFWKVITSLVVAILGGTILTIGILAWLVFTNVVD